MLSSFLTQYHLVSVDHMLFQVMREHAFNYVHTKCICCPFDDSCDILVATPGFDCRENALRGHCSRQHHVRLGPCCWRPDCKRVSNHGNEPVDVDAHIQLDKIAIFEKLLVFVTW